MDKQNEIISNITKNIIYDIDQEIKNSKNNVQFKNDGSPVTDLDNTLSELIEKKCSKLYPHLTYYSEEKFSVWNFPMLIVDPIDGTKEFIANVPEWTVSIACISNENWLGDGWIYNPTTKKAYNITSIQSLKVKDAYCGEVSNSEWKKGLFTNKSTEKFKLRPMGSIAYKLGRLSAGECDFVVSLAPKNIWDIAAGVVLCNKAGYKFYSEGKEVTEVKQKYFPPLIWCHESIKDELFKIFP